MTVCVDHAVAREVATAYSDTPSRPDRLVVAAYAHLSTESDRIFRPGAIH
jgi:hypothetical protein